MRRSQLTAEGVIAVERALDDMREVAEEEHQHQRIFLCFRGLPVHIDDIAYAHQRVVRDAERHQELQRRDRP